MRLQRGGYVNLLAAKVIGGMDLELIRDAKNDGDRTSVCRSRFSLSLEVAERWFCVMGWSLVKIRVPWNSTRWLRWISYERADGSRKVRDLKCLKVGEGSLALGAFLRKVRFSEVLQVSKMKLTRRRT